MKGKMACFTPITLYLSREGKNPKTGKWSYTSVNKGYRDKPRKFPCGHCIGCYMEYSRQWAVRCEFELSRSSQSAFLTMTYNDESLVYHEGSQRATLHPRDLELFWKRYRKEHGRGIRYFACGEYGDKLGRPHYHAIIFGHDFKDKKFYTIKGGHILYTSPSLNALWGLGNCYIGSATFESCAYVARYVLKKKYGQAADYYEREGILPEFVRMSRGGNIKGSGGIGAEWFEKFESDVFPHDYVVIRGGIKVRPPKYFMTRYQKKFDSLLYPDYHPMDLEQLKEERLKNQAENWRENTDARLNVRHILAKYKAGLLKRD